MDPHQDRVSAAFGAVPREEFLPAGYRAEASYDGPIPIGHGQTNSQPATVAAMLRLLEVEPGQRVLDVGAGSGWTTALLAHLVGPTGLVVGVELVPELAAWGEQNVRRTSGAWASVREATPGVLGVPELAPYDRILVSAEAGRLPTALLDQLGDPGRMVVPVAGVMTVVERAGGEDRTGLHGHYRFVPLR
ncbi:protein-L-isoaspartate O-methyltransferase family protein [Nocardioides pocheonensis]|jgi:protein-L-isoaspartate(D-aspartate) O-methyltransferase|uniref:Protein-L-isoaspartate O-methyltransferase n=1 Tax=Nocardioides pocheonensis TaxID=661485 RepID=A0A3N0GZC0_9ACTN|nr:fibrillarin-like rRNA/tRNA 2'-O-methyltransferase [Nocardioides pocheonensis]RNM17749.1 protein-L-isoaspartate carboxylmethyltransferase [Nocardioides pocheonensis]